MPAAPQSKRSQQFASVFMRFNKENVVQGLMCAACRGNARMMCHCSALRDASAAGLCHYRAAKKSLEQIRCFKRWVAAMETDPRIRTYLRLTTVCGAMQAFIFQDWSWLLVFTVIWSILVLIWLESSSKSAGAGTNWLPLAMAVPFLGYPCYWEPRWQLL